MKVYNDPKCRKAIRKILKPLQKDGIDTFEIRSLNSKGDHKAIVLLDKEDAYLFYHLGDNQDMHKYEKTYERARITIIAPAFDRELKWRFDFHGKRISADIRDEKFWEKLNHPENSLSFKPGDQLEVILVTHRPPRGRHSYSIEKVLEIHKR